MSNNDMPLSDSLARARGIAVVIGLGAVVAAFVLTMIQRDDSPGAADLPVAGSGSAPVNTSYAPPVEGDMTGMNLGATVIDTTTPPTALPTSIAVPAIKAGH
ncbi:exported hypothetical protein [uncultured Mycobacterium sp.]|uniref:Uncharacterized protein n=2 Tax=Mycobacteriaceae TaxID=1762 RepID=A0A064CEA8_9MYCO|nr:hypothetical protein [Mycolicibacterium aromaticivorans]KDE97087.1 hypothetical protein Y900_027760 [Mycolicibacterium aromaticivorans JS19b1 = JCM 16368]SBS78067.1 exported hypothetical protein [uncultured Mycobacterium sp.]